MDVQALIGVLRRSARHPIALPAATAGDDHYEGAIAPNTRPIESRRPGHDESRSAGAAAEREDAERDEASTGEGCTRPIGGFG
jgi:hypothetical protein